MGRPDFSNYVAHFTKGRAPYVTQNDDVQRELEGTSARDRLVSILEYKIILATNMPFVKQEAVAFTECPFWSFLDHVRQYSPYVP